MEDREKQLIVNALLFTGCVDVINNLDEKAQMEMIDIAMKMNTNPTDDVEIYGDIFEQPKIAKKIIDNFTIKHE